jgi:hypothetical protein
MSSTFHDELLHWSNELLATGSLEDFAGVLTRPPAGGGAPITANLVLLDGGHELRHLAAGDSGISAASSALHFVEGLGGVARTRFLRSLWSARITRRTMASVRRGCGRHARDAVACRVIVRSVVSSTLPVAVVCLNWPPRTTWLEHVAGQVVANVRAAFYRHACSAPASWIRFRVEQPRYLQRLREEVAQPSQSPAGDVSNRRCGGCVR